MTMLKRHWIAAIILCLFMALGIVYSVATPVLEASDELNHYPFVAYLAGGNGLPVQRPGEETLWGQEGSQPPLYYALAAALTSWIDVDDLTELVILNPHAMRGVPLAPDNKNMVVHSSRRHFHGGGPCWPCTSFDCSRSSSLPERFCAPTCSHGRWSPGSRRLP